ncbi:unnamed protein product [Durusdinium trenchii]|uniref:Uncharacterized protein n=1 Tax=Durusdinium trenchii TaxID=1381693 RepID=A0ABP0MYF8_9DINO
MPGSSAIWAGAPMPFRHESSFLRCTRPRLWPDPLTGLPCRDPEEESCNEVHATCAHVPKVGWTPDVKDPLSFVEPKGACELPVERPPPSSPGGALGTLNKLQDAANAVGNAASMAQSLASGGAQNSDCVKTQESMNVMTAGWNCSMNFGGHRYEVGGHS